MSEQANCEMEMHIMRLRGWVLAMVCFVWLPGFSGSAGSLPAGKKNIYLVPAAGAEFRIGAVEFTPDGDGARFAVTMDAPQFGDEFLSMRPFRCLPGFKEMWCHLEYPYDMKRRITSGDLVDLEYALLFLFKPPGGYGIDPWNGLYFKLAVQDDGSIAGDVNDVNLDVLGVPPDDRSARVVRHEDLSVADPGTHAFARLVIR